MEDNLHKVIYFFKQSFEKQLFRKVSDEAKICEKTDIVVVGAGSKCMDRE